MSSFRGKFLEVHQGKNKARGYNNRRILAQNAANMSTTIAPGLHYFTS